MKQFLIIFLCFISVNSFAEVINLTIKAQNLSFYEKEKCELKERGSAIKKNVFQKDGQSYGNKYCVVELTNKEFYKNFKYCSLSGFEHGSSFIDPECSFYSTQKGFEFLASFEKAKSDTSTLFCSFSCLTK